jgi:hypothetical protein
VDLAIFSLHLAGVSSLLGAINSNNILDFDFFMSFTFILIKIKNSRHHSYDASKIFIFYKRLLSFNCNSNINFKKNKQSVNFNDSIKISYKLADEHIKSEKPVNFKIINDILAYCNIKITEDVLKILINVPSLDLNDLDKDETIKIL